MTFLEGKTLFFSKKSSLTPISTKKRDPKTELQCSGCLHGFHSTCLEPAIGTSKLAQLQVKLHWLCDNCTGVWCGMMAKLRDIEAGQPSSQSAQTTEHSAQTDQTEFET